MKESDIQAQIMARINAYGGYVRKFLSAQIGVPDLIAVLDGKTFFIEVKAPGGRVNDAQKREHVRIKTAGGTVLVMNSVEQFDEVLALCGRTSNA